MELNTFVVKWNEFNTQIAATPGQSSISDEAKVKLFGIWFEDNQKQAQAEQFGLGGLMKSLGASVQQTLDEVEKKNKGETWRGEEH